MKAPLFKRFLMCALAASALFSASVQSAYAGTFNDVSENHPYLPAITHLKENGVIIGYEDGSFRPDNEVNRAEALKIITLGHKILGEKVSSQDAQNIFDMEARIGEELGATSDVDFDLNDVPADSWYRKYVYQAFKNGIISGYGDRTFRPSNTITLAEAVKILLETSSIEIPSAESLSKNPFKDVSLDAWYAPYMQVAKKRYIVIADMDLNINPEENLTRKELANLMYRHYTMEEGRTYGRASYYADYFQGKGTASGEAFDQSLYTGASLTLPFGSLVKVVNLENNKSVIVRINDRGPYDERFIVDLSKQAFETISPLSRGVIQIYYEIIHTP